MEKQKNTQDNVNNYQRRKELESIFAQRAEDSQTTLLDVRSEGVFDGVSSNRLVEQRTNVKMLFDDTTKLFSEYATIGGTSVDNYDKHHACYLAIDRILGEKVIVMENATISKINSKDLDNDREIEGLLGDE